MKKVIKKFFSVALAMAMISVISLPVKAANTEAVTETVTDAEINMLAEENAILLDSSTFVVKADGTVVYDEVQTSSARLSDVVTGTMSYYYLGKDSQNRPEYQMVMSIVSETNLKSSVLSTKAEGVSDWHDNSATHSGKTGTNTRTYVYTSANPPSNPYCYAKATITISDGTTYRIPSKKYTDPISK